MPESKLSFSHGLLGTKSGSVKGVFHPGLKGLREFPEGGATAVGESPGIGDNPPTKDLFFGGRGGGVEGSSIDKIARSSKGNAVRRFRCYMLIYRIRKSVRTPLSGKGGFGGGLSVSSCNETELQSALPRKSSNRLPSDDFEALLGEDGGGRLSTLK